jgi:hypothetical protein
MTEDERKAKDAARKREAYARRKAALSTKHPTHYEGNPTPDHEEAWRMVQTDGKPISAEDIVHYVDSREKAEATISEAVAREEYVNHLFSPYSKTTNTPQLLQGIIREQIETRVVLIDLLAEILKGVSK